MTEPLQITPTQKPSVGLQQWLGYGALGALATGVLWASSSAISVTDWQGGTVLTESMDLVALLMLAVVLIAYWKLSHETAAPGLRKSALGLLGILVVLELANLNTPEGDAHWWNIVIWVVLALATVGLVIVIWNLEEIENDAAGKKASPTNEDKHAAEALSSPSATDAATVETAPQVIRPTDDKPASARRTRLGVGALAVLGLFLLKLLAKVGGRLAWKKVAPVISGDLIGGLLFLALLLLAVVFLVWFAVVKIRLRTRLGALSAWVGSVELLAVLVGGLAVGGMLWDFVQVARQIGMDEKAMDAGIEAAVATWSRRAGVGAILGSAVWAVLTAGLFLNYRRRLGEEPT
jgi:hypothetical protein